MEATNRGVPRQLDFDEKGENEDIAEKYPDSFPEFDTAYSPLNSSSISEGETDHLSALSISSIHNDSNDSLDTSMLSIPGTSTSISSTTKKKRKEVKVVPSRYMVPKATPKDKSTSERKKIAPSPAEVILKSRVSATPLQSKSKMESNRINVSATPLSSVQARLLAAPLGGTLPARLTTASTPSVSALKKPLKADSAIKPKVSKQGVAPSTEKKTEIKRTELFPTEKSFSAMANDIMILQGQLLQWKFANAQAESSFKNREEQAMKILYNKWMHVQKLKEELHNKKEELRKQIINVKLNNSIRAEYPHLSDPTALLSFTENYKELSEAVYATMHRMPTNDVVVDAEELQKILQHSKETLDQFESAITAAKNLTQLSYVAESLEKLKRVAADEQTELMKCKELLSTFSILERQKQSETIQQLHSTQSGV